MYINFHFCIFRPVSDHFWIGLSGLRTLQFFWDLCPNSLFFFRNNLVFLVQSFFSSVSVFFGTNPSLIFLFMSKLSNVFTYCLTYHRVLSKGHAHTFKMDLKSLNRNLGWPFVKKSSHCEL